MVLDCNLRYQVYRGNIDRIPTVSQTLRTTELEKSFEDFFIVKETQSTTVLTCIHPMDIQMAIFHCADDFTRQYILTKLSICQFALPLLVPNPCNFPSLVSEANLQEKLERGRKNRMGEKIRSYNNQLISWQPIHTVSFLKELEIMPLLPNHRFEFL